MKISFVRNEYNLSGISRNTVLDNPIKQFEKWLKEALDSDEKQPTAMSLVTIGTDNFPDSRIVLLKYFDEKGFVFFTNFNSEKGKAIERNNSVGLHFFWPFLERQVRISGLAEKTSKELSETYFQSRPVESQISAWSSEQSKIVESREVLEKKYEEIKNKFNGKKIDLPPYWGGFLVVPQKIEFWQGRENRLHDRILYEKVGPGWDIKRLSP